MFEEKIKGLFELLREMDGSKVMEIIVQEILDIIKKWKEELEFLGNV